ncbi:MAG: hypothetical protein GEU74_11840 [Nitriliruptorales bacterium]|nr:hypothetical protein [Nitriliruptorales bacterium]
MAPIARCCSGSGTGPTSVPGPSPGRPTPHGRLLGTTLTTCGDRSLRAMSPRRWSRRHGSTCLRNQYRSDPMGSRTSTEGTGTVPAVAFVGLGWWGNQLAEAVERSGAARVASCFARSPDAREAFAAAHNCATATDLDDLLANQEIDAIVLATPHSTHLPMIKAAAEAAKHVFVEKPLAVSYRDASEAVTAARAAGIVLQVGHHRRKVAATRALRRRLDNGAFGLVHLLEAKQTTPSDLTPRVGGGVIQPSVRSGG